MTTNRLEHIDLARTMAVVSVIAYHFLRIDEIWGMSTFINTYFLSLFFFISGLLMHPKAEIAWLIKKMKRLLIPLIAFSAVFIPVSAWCNDISLAETVHSMVWSDSKGGYWFVYTLFAAITLIWLIHYAYVKWNIPRWVYGLAVLLPWLIACGLSVILPQDISYLLSIPSFRRYYPFILMGMICEKDRIQNTLRQTGMYVFVTIGYLLFTILSLWKFQTVVSNISFGIWFVTNTFGCLFVIEICRRICARTHIHTLTKWLSQDSLGIYLGQFIIRCATKKPFMALPLSPYITFIPYTLLLLAVSLTATRLLRRNSITTKIFLGQ